MDAQSVAFAQAVSSTSADATGSTGEIKLPPLPPPPDSPEPDQLSPASAAPVEKAIKDDEAHTYICIYIYIYIIENSFQNSTGSSRRLAEVSG